MPELPEVERFRQYVAEAAQGKRFVSFSTENEGRMLPQGIEKIKQDILGEKLVQTHRIGKYLFLEMGNGKVMMWHFGLTGDPVYYRAEEEKPRFARLVFGLDDGFSLALNCMRKFGRLKVAESVADFQRENKLGVDAMEIDSEAFYQALHKRKIAIKTALLDQKHFAGVGNWIADEMLYQARIYPEVHCQHLDKKDFSRLHQLMQEIIQTALDHGGVYQEFPPHFMVGHRWGDGLCPETGAELVRIVVGGRGTFFSPPLQPQPN
ncbi:MAG: DNA-formamidopyrimidine glycosylase family protein [Bacteroidota bacterium]